MKILVTGGTGYIGSAMLSALLQHGHEVHSLARRLPQVPVEAVHWIQGDLGSLPKKLPAVDAVMHFAQAQVTAPDHAEEMHDINTTSTLRLLEYARRCGAERFMLASTGNVYGFGSRPFSEEDPLRPQGFYAVTKMNAENLVHSYGSFMHTAVLRFFSPYGAGQTARLIPDLIRRVREGRPVILKEGGRPHLTPIYIDDVVEVCCRLLEHEAQLTVNVAGDQHISLREIAEIFGEISGHPPVFEELAEPAPGDLTADNARMKKLTGITRLISVREGLSRMI